MTITQEFKDTWFDNPIWKAWLRELELDNQQVLLRQIMLDELPIGYIGMFRAYAEQQKRLQKQIT